MDHTALQPNWMGAPIIPPIIAMAREDYQRLSPTPQDFDYMFGVISKMADTEPNYTAQELARIHGPRIAIVDGDHEELIKPEHIRYLAHTIPGAQLIILKDVSHGAPIQDPDQFNKTLIAFLDAK
jgi:pimeloyl-ACP methyl ester carboxylesterase